MTKKLIIVIIKDLVMIAIIIVIKLTYRQNSMEEKKNENKQTNLTWLRNWSG